MRVNKVRKTGTSNNASTESATATEGQGFYGRWSQRKQQVRERQAPGGDTVAAMTAPGEIAPETLNSDPPAPELLTDRDMPALESLGADSDYSSFLSAGVSEELRNKALRQLFQSPQFNIVDGLDDYCEDFRNFELLGDIVTADMRYEREYEVQRTLEREQKRERQQRMASQSDSEAVNDLGSDNQSAQQTGSPDAEAQQAQGSAHAEGSEAGSREGSVDSADIGDNPQDDAGG